MKVGRNGNSDIIVIFSKDVFGENGIPVVFETDYFSLPAKEGRGTLKIF